MTLLECKALGMQEMCQFMEIGLSAWRSELTEESALSKDKKTKNYGWRKVGSTRVSSDRKIYYGCTDAHRCLARYSSNP